MAHSRDGLTPEHLCGLHVPVLLGKQTWTGAQAGPGTLNAFLGSRSGLGDCQDTNRAGSFPRLVGICTALYTCLLRTEAHYGGWGGPQGPSRQECCLHDSQVSVFPGVVLGQRELPCSLPKGSHTNTPKVRQRPQPRPQFRTPLRGHSTSPAGVGEASAPSTLLLLGSPGLSCLRPPWRPSFCT